MSDNTKVVSSGGMGFLGWLTILFIALKLTGFITWSWFWVLAPMIFGFGLVITILILIGLLANIR
jgi:fatty acid desaturase